MRRVTAFSSLGALYPTTPPSLELLFNYGGAFRKYPLTLVSRNLTSVFFSVPLSIIHLFKRKFSSGLNSSN